MFLRMLIHGSQNEVKLWLPLYREQGKPPSQCLRNTTLSLQF